MNACVETEALSAHALAVIEGESCARAYLRRLEAGRSSPGDLAAMLGHLDGELFAGACRELEKQLERRNG